MNIWYIIVGVLAGILGGMGMGGGTLLIPLLTIFFEVDQVVAQGINLLSFIPMSVVALIFHFKNKLVDFKNFFWLVIPACVLAVLGAILAGKTDNEVLQKCFGGFLMALSVFQIVSEFFLKKGEEKDSEKKEKKSK